MEALFYKGAEHIVDVPLLKVTAVSVAYASLGKTDSQEKALENLSFVVDAGEQIAIVGPNGAGKSTLFKLLAGILKPDEGKIEMLGSEPDKHICIAYVTQSNQIDWSFPVSVRDVVMMGRIKEIGLFRRPSRRDHEIVLHALQRVGADHLVNKQIGELSGGQQQRVFIARALAQDANLLLFDEPLTGLDLPSQEAIFDILTSLKADGVTVLLATHDLHLAGEKFDRVMLLNKKIMAMGEGTAVLTSENLLKAYRG